MHMCSASLQRACAMAALLLSGILAPDAAGQGAARATPDPYAPVRYTFETGTLQGWTIQSGSFGRLVSDRAVFYNRPSIPYNKQGAYFLSTEQTPAGGRSDAYTGVVVSPRFTLTRPTISFLIGGGAGPGVYVAVYTAQGKMIYQ